MPRLLNFLPWRRRRLERDLERELRHHIDQRVDDLKQTGISDADATRQAALEFGALVGVQEDTRDTWVWRWLDDLGRDVRYGVRMLVRSPVFTATAVLSLAIGIGANAAIFSLIDRILLRALAVDEPERLVYLTWRGNALASGWGSGYLVSYPLCRELEQQDQIFDGVLCRHPTTVNLSTGAQPEEVRAEIVSGSYFHVLGARPALGRLIDASDDLQPGTHPVAVISHAYWQDRLGRAPDVIGRTVRLNNYPMTVIGVAPPDFRGVDPHVLPAVWVPAAMTVQAANIDAYWDRLLDRRAAWMHAIGRLKRGVTIERARAGLQPWFQSMLEADTRREGFPVVTGEQRRQFLASTIEVLPAPRGMSTLRQSLERPLSLLLGGTVLLLALSSLNVAGLLLARGAARRRELTTRLALGATRLRISRQLLVESALITTAGAVLGLAAAPAVSRLLLSVLSRDGDIGVAIDRRIFAFALLVSAATAMVCALAPASYLRRVPLITSLRERTTASSGARARKALVVGQLALALILLIGAGLFVETLAQLRDKGAGFSRNHLVMFRVNPPAFGYSEADAERTMRDVLRRIRNVPGVDRAAIANITLLGGFGASNRLTLDRNGRVVTDRAVSRMRVTPDFFSTVGTQVVRGRDFDTRDVRAADSLPRPYRTALVNESFARRYFTNENPVGHRMGMGNGPDTPLDIEIIGVVRDFSSRTLRDVEVEQVYLQFWDQNSGDGTFYLSVRDRSESIFAAIRQAVAQVDPALPVPLTTVEDQMELSLRTERMLATLSGSFGAIAGLLAVIGLYGVMSFVVRQRTQEIGVRLALGATRSTAVWLVVRDAAAMIAAAAALALPCTWALGRLLGAQLFGVTGFDGPTVAVVTAMLTAVALGAALAPAWRAASIAPTEALRFE
jgi:predicted permease